MMDFTEPEPRVPLPDDAFAAWKRTTAEALLALNRNPHQLVAQVTKLVNACTRLSPQARMQLAHELAEEERHAKRSDRPSPPSAH